MKWLILFFATLLGIIGIDMIIKFFKHNMIVLIDKEFIEEEDMESEYITGLKPDYTKSIDLRGTPTHVCVCGCNVWNVKTVFDDFQIVQYFLDMECAQCGSLATAPTPVDKGME